MIVCTQPFFNELDLLEIKLHTMSPAVDMFVVCEATRTYMGTSKPLYFDENKSRFSEFQIKHVVVDNLPLDCDAWAREGFQHDRMFEAVQTLKADAVLFLDTDEIVKPEAIHAFMATDWPLATLDMTWLRFFANREHNARWKQRVIARDGNHHVSSVPGLPEIPNAGWHFNYVRDKQSLLDTINSTSHATDPRTGWFWHETRANRHPQLDLTVPYDESKLPRYLAENKQKFGHLFLPDGTPLV